MTVVLPRGAIFDSLVGAILVWLRGPFLVKQRFAIKGTIIKK